LNRASASALSIRERVVLIREIGRRFGIPVLSRERCLDLAVLIAGKKKFVFQWGEGAYVQGDRSLIKWKKLGSDC